MTLLLVVSVLAAGTGRAADQPAASTPRAAQVTIDNFTFNPPTLKVTTGTTITWTNRDDMPHTVVAQDKSFRSSALDTDQTFSHTFAQPGEFVYFCSIHSSMVGKVIVRR